ncbi:MAG: ABC transporter substrate-binding protein [Methanoregula sp.]
MKAITLMVVACAVIAIVLFTAGCTQPAGQPTSSNVTLQKSSVSLVYMNPGQMPQLLATGQVDGYMAWQPFVSIADVSKIGTVVSYSQDLPPKQVWEDHSCDSLVARNDIVSAHPDMTNALSAVFVEATNYTRNNPDRAAEISADWLFGSSNLTYGNVTINSVDVEKASIPTIKFTNDPSDQWIASNDRFIGALKEIGFISGTLSNVTPNASHAMLYNFVPYNTANGMLATKTIVSPSTAPAKISIGYLLSDHDAPLFVAVKNWKYFLDNYGFALKPKVDTAGKVEQAELIVNNQKVADVQLVKGDGGPQLMTLLGSNTIDFAVAGTPPTIAAVDKGTPIKILFPVHTEGSGLVVTSKSSAKDWNSFIAWINERSASGKPVKIAVAPKGSIQDVQLEYALEQSGVAVTEAK